MRIILYIVQKEFIQVFRNRMMLPIIFLVPIIQLVVLVHAASFEIQTIRVLFVDEDNSSLSRALIDKFQGTPLFSIVQITTNRSEGPPLMMRNKVDLIIQFPPDFETNILRKKHEDIQIKINAIDGSAADLVNAYTQSVIAKFNKENGLQLSPRRVLPQAFKIINATTAYWYNPHLKYKNYMVPGILVLLVTIVGIFLSGMNVVREKEIGTIEQINVTPVKKYQFLAGKLIPFLVIALFELSFGLLIGKLFFKIPFAGSIPLVFGIAILYLLVILGFGLLISTLTHTQQQAMFIAFFFMLIFVLMSGLFTPAESMPVWARVLNKINPIAYFMKIIRMILLKGSRIADVKHEILSLMVYAGLIFPLALWRYRKKS